MSSLEGSEHSLQGMLISRAAEADSVFNVVFLILEHEIVQYVARAAQIF